MRSAHSKPYPAQYTNQLLRSAQFSAWNAAQYQCSWFIIKSLFLSYSYFQVSSFAYIWYLTSCASLWSASHIVSMSIKLSHTKGSARASTRLFPCHLSTISLQMTFRSLRGVTMEAKTSRRLRGCVKINSNVFRTWFCLMIAGTQKIIHVKLIAVYYVSPPALNSLARMWVVWRH